MFSIFCGPFFASKKVKSFAIKQIRTLSAKHPGGESKGVRTFENFRLLHHERPFFIHRFFSWTYESPFPFCTRPSIFISRIFMHLQIPFPANPGGVGNFRSSPSNFQAFQPANIPRGYGKSHPGGTMPDRLDDFQKFRADLNEEILGCGHLGIKRFFALDHQAYEPGSLGTKTKELLGLVASTVLRCDDCITYHLVRCGEEGWKRDEVIDALNVALIVGGSITIPHVRRAFARMREIDGLKNS
jgi:AhpD family alkylhydroperoxidase